MTEHSKRHSRPGYRKNRALRFIVELTKTDAKKLEKLCNLHNRSYLKEIEVMIRFYHKNHLRTEQYLK